MEKTEVVRVSPEQSVFLVPLDPADPRVTRLQGHLEGQEGNLRFEAPDPNNRFEAANTTSSRVEVYKEN